MLRSVSNDGGQAPVTRKPRTAGRTTRANPETLNSLNVSEDLLRNPVRGQRPGQCLAYRPGGRPRHYLRAHDEPGVVVDPGHDLDFLPAGQVNPAHDIHLPQLHR